VRRWHLPLEGRGDPTHFGLKMHQAAKWQLLNRNFNGASIMTAQKKCPRTELKLKHPQQYDGAVNIVNAYAR